MSLEKQMKYLHVSKRLLEIPVIAVDGSLTNIKQVVAEKKGTSYRNPNKELSREDERRLNFRTMGWSKFQTDAWRRADAR